MILVKIPKFLRKWYKYRGTTIAPFIFYKWEKDKYDKFFINHEKIHIRQQVELLWIVFFIWYIGEYLLYRIMGLDHSKAYRNISFEKEAYYNEKDIDYLDYRKTWSFLKYFKYPK